MGVLLGKTGRGLSCEDREPPPRPQQGREREEKNGCILRVIGYMGGGEGKTREVNNRS